MMLNGDAMKMIDLMQKGMGASVLRAEVLNNNIANASTPNYKRHDVTFQAELERAINSENIPDIELKASSEKHMPAYRPKDYQAVKPKVTTEYNSYQNNDGNSVDIEKEMMESSKNTMYFNSMADLTAKKFNLLKFLLKS